MSKLKLLISFFLFSATVGLSAQFTGFQPPKGTRVDADTALTQALKASSLTEGDKPFHAVLNIGNADSPYSGQIQIWWVTKQKNKVVINSPSFSQTRIVNGADVKEVDSGDYYPRWIQSFVEALLDPIPMIDNFRGRKGSVMLGEQIMRSCLQRDDRPHGITDVMTWGNVCLGGTRPHIVDVLTMNYGVEFSDWKSFHGQEIARTYTTDVLAYQQVVAHLVTLEDLKHVTDDDFAITNPTPLDQQIKTAFVSTQKEETLLENAPIIDWPAVHEGKTEGYMIVYARTDRTGQVRESAKHNSDQPGLEDFGMAQALRYKFKPLVVDGVPQQMEMPLVLHFISKLVDPLPLLSGQELLNQISDCNAKLITEPPTSGNITPTKISVNEVGKFTGESFGPDIKVDYPAVLIKSSSALGLECHFAPYLRNGVAWYYHGILLVAH